MLSLDFLKTIFFTFQICLIKKNNLFVLLFPFRNGERLEGYMVIMCLY